MLQKWAVRVAAAAKAPREVRTFFGVLHATGCRISEALALTAQQIDLSGRVVVFESLKKRRKGIYRAVPVPPELPAPAERPSCGSTAKGAPLPARAAAPPGCHAPGRGRPAMRHHAGDRHAAFLADFLGNCAIAFPICPPMLQKCAFR
jgi:Phage integrase family